MAQAYQTIEDDVLDIVGEALAADLGLSSVMLDDMATNVAKEIMMMLPDEALKNIAKQETAFDPDAGMAVENFLILEVARNDSNSVRRKSEEVPASLFGSAAEKGSLYEATEFSPVHTFEPQTSGAVKLKVLPASSDSVALVSSAQYPAIDVDVDKVNTITGFPDELSVLLIPGTVIKIKWREAGKCRRDSQDELEAITSSGYLTAFEGDLPVFAPPATPSIPSLTLVSMSDIPSLSLEPAPGFTDLDLSGISTPTSVLAYTTAGAEPEDTISVSTSLPAYVGPSSFTYDGSTHVSDALENAQKMIDDSGIKATTDVETLLNTDYLDSARVGIEACRAELQRAQTSIQDERAQLQEFAEEFREALGKFNGETSVYQAELAKEVAEAQVDVAAYTAKMNDNKNILDKEIAQYNGDVQNYAAQVRATAQEWQLEEVSFKLAKWVGRVQSQTAEYSAVAGSTVNEYSSKNQALIAEYNAKANGIISKYQALVQGEAAEFQANLSKAMSRLQEAQVRLQTMQSFDQKSTMALNEAIRLQEEFDKKLGVYIARFKKEPQLMFADRRRR